MEVKQVRLVEKPLDPSQHIAHVAMYNIGGANIRPFDPPENATPSKPGLVKQAAHVDGATGTVADLVTALVNAGIMAGTEAADDNMGDAPAASK